MPASDSLLSIFITTHRAGQVGKGALCSWLSGIKLWHMINGAPWYAGPCVTRAVKGAASFTPPSSHHPPRLPITIHHLCSLKVHLNLSNTFDTAVWAVTCIAFWCQCSLNELCSDSPYTCRRAAAAAPSPSCTCCAPSVAWPGRI